MVVVVWLAGRGGRRLAGWVGWVAEGRGGRRQAGRLAGWLGCLAS